MTTIQRSKGRNQQTGKFHLDITTLVDGGVFGRWIVNCHTEGTLNFQTTQGVYEFRLLDTGETLEVTKEMPAGKVTGEYCIKFSNTVVTLKDKDIGKDSGAFLPRLQSDASEKFQKGLRFIKSLAFSVPDAFVSIEPFEALSGTPDSSFLRGRVIRYDELVVDCNFDATFGYPCEPGEQPGRPDGKIYVKPITK